MKNAARNNRQRSQKPDPVDVHVGARLRLRRNLIGMSQEQLASASGLTFQQIQKYERGTNRIAASRLVEFANALKVSPSYFFEDTPEPGHRPPGFSDNAQAALEGMPEGDFLQRKETLELVRAYYRIKDPKQRRAAYNLIKSMADHAG